MQMSLGCKNSRKKVCVCKGHRFWGFKDKYKAVCKMLEIIKPSKVFIKYHKLWMLYKD